MRKEIGKGRPFIMNSMGKNIRVVKIRLDKYGGAALNPSRRRLAWETISKYRKGNYIVLEQRRIQPHGT